MYWVCSSQHQISNRKITPSLEQIKKNLMSLKLTVHQAGAIAQLHTSRAVPNIRHTKQSNSSFDIHTQNTENNLAIALKHVN